MQPDTSKLLELTGIKTSLTGFYDTPDATPFAPLIDPRDCFFSAWKDWMTGKSVLLRKDKFSCGGSGMHLCGVQMQSKEAMLTFLV